MIFGLCLESRGNGCLTTNKFRQMMRKNWWWENNRDDFDFRISTSSFVLVLLVPFTYTILILLMIKKLVKWKRSLINQIEQKKRFKCSSYFVKFAIFFLFRNSLNLAISSDQRESIKEIYLVQMFSLSSTALVNARSGHQHTKRISKLSHTWKEYEPKRSYDLTYKHTG